MNNRTGWTFGVLGSDLEGRRWLSVLGSLRKRPALHATKAEAEAELTASGLLGNPHISGPVVAARVREESRTAFRVLEL